MHEIPAMIQFGPHIVEWWHHPPRQTSPTLEIHRQHQSWLAMSAILLSELF